MKQEAKLGILGEFQQTSSRNVDNVDIVDRESSPRASGWFNFQGWDAVVEKGPQPEQAGGMYFSRLCEASQQNTLG